MTDSIPCTTDESQRGEFALVFGIRQITSISLVLVLVIGTLCAVAYVAGRSSGLGSSGGVAMTSAGPPVVPSRAQPACPPPPKCEAATKPSAGMVKKEIVPGALYYQLFSVEPGIAEVFAEGLAVRGFSVVVGAGANASVARLLVGPVEPDDSGNLRSRLETLGFHVFGRKY